MNTIRRTRTIVQEPARRVRRRLGTSTADETNFKKRAALGDLINLVAQRQDELTHAATLLADAERSLLSSMQSMHLSEVTEGPFVATVERAAGRTTNTIDPVKFREKVSDDKEFFGAISVSMTAAKKVLPEKTLARITTSVPGTPGDPKVKVVRMKASAKLKAK